MKTGADSLVTVKDSQLTAAEDLTISSKVKSEIGSETGGALGREGSRDFCGRQ